VKGGASQQFNYLQSLSHQNGSIGDDADDAPVGDVTGTVDRPTLPLPLPFDVDVGPVGGVGGDDGVGDGALSLSLAPLPFRGRLFGTSEVSSSSI
jgi:hypothetical protein